MFLTCRFAVTATRLASAFWCCALCFPTWAAGQTHSHADAHAPIGVMGDHTHSTGEWMLSYRFMRMTMRDNRDGTSDLSPQEIAQSASNPFANPPTQPPGLRVVPLDMRMDMHMLGAMYAPSDRVTFMGMLNVLDLSMDHLTFAGPVGTNPRGEFTTTASGIGDLSLAALIALPQQGTSQWHATLGLSLPTGSISQRDVVLAPTGMRPELKLPYPMQLGSGTYDAITGLTVRNQAATRASNWGWGAQWRSTWRLGHNSAGYARGHEHGFSAWLNREWQPDLSTSIRLSYLHRDNLRGKDDAISAPVQTADPQRQGLDRVELSLGINYQFPNSSQRLALEYSRPVHQDLDGPQLKTDWQLTLGWQWALPSAG